MQVRELIQLLRQRELTDVEWDKLLAASEDDPFLRDALDGLRSVPHEKRVDHLRQISQHISSRSKNKRRVLFVRFGAAAGILILIAAAVWLGEGYLTSNSADGGLVQQHTEYTTKETPYTNKKADVKSSNEEQLAIEPGNDAMKVPPELPAESARSIPSTAKKKTQTANIVTTEQKEPDITDVMPSESDIAYNTPDAELSANPAEATPEEPVNTRISKADETDFHVDGARISDAASQQSKNIESRTARDANLTAAAIMSEGVDSNGYVITGTITGDDFEPLIGANVHLQGSQYGTITDFDGKYKLQLPDDSSFDSANLIATYTGYQSTSVKIKDRQNIDIELQGGTELNEVIVAGQQQGAPKIKKNHPKGNHAYALAAPVDGWKDFYRYVRKNIITPDSAESANMEGTVSLEFDLDEEGRPTEIRVVASLGYGCDEEAIRLVREGPDWDVEGAQVPIGRIDIDF